MASAPDSKIYGLDDFSTRFSNREYFFVSAKTNYQSELTEGIGVVILKKYLLTITAVISFLLLGACSVQTSEEPRPSLTPLASNIGSSPAPTTEESGPKTPADFDAIDVKYDEFEGAVAGAPYGIDYSSLGERSLPESDTHFEASQIATATQVALDTYYKIRTAPALYKSSRTPATDDTVIHSVAGSLGSFLLDDWSDDRDNLNKLFDFVPTFPYVSGEVYDTDRAPSEASRYYIDTSKTQSLNYDNVTVEPSMFSEFETAGLIVRFHETAKYSLENNSRATSTSQITLILHEDAPGTWQIQGMHWTDQVNKLYDSNDQPLPMLKS